MGKISIVDRAKTAVVLDHPFFASLLLKRQLIEDTSIPTAGVDARGQIYYNPKWMELRTVPQAVFVLCHEILHTVYQHPSRVGVRHKLKWNIAGDAVINDVLIQSKVGEFVDGGVNMPGSMAKTADQVYNELPDVLEIKGGKGKGQQGQEGVGGIGDDLLERGGPLSKEEAEQLEAQNKLDIAAAANAAKLAGNLPGALAKMVADIIEVRTPWYDILERYMTAFARGDYTWARPNRRYLSTAYLPATGSIPKMGEILIQIDVSGSISKKELDYYNGHLKRIVAQCNPERVHVIYVDTHVARHDVFECGEEVNLEFYSGGGTHMPEGFEWAKREGIEPEVHVILTDGYTDFGNKPGWDVVWCISSAQRSPWGVNIPFSLED